MSLARTLKRHQIRSGFGKNFPVSYPNGRGTFRPCMPGVWAKLRELNSKDMKSVRRLRRRLALKAGRKAA